jgi:hypothetical protein
MFAHERCDVSEIEILHMNPSVLIARSINIDSLSARTAWLQPVSIDCIVCDLC